MAHRLFRLALSASILLSSALARAQERVPVRVEARGGYAVFADEGSGDHTAFGAGARWVAAARFAAGPELTYMIGPGRDRDLFLIGAFTADLLRESRVTPFVVGAAGLMSHSDAFNSWSAFVFEFGPGARIKVSDPFYVGVEYRMGKPLHARLDVSVGYQF